MSDTNKVCGNCFSMFDGEGKKERAKSMGVCDNVYSPFCRQIVYYDTAACDEYHETPERRHKWQRRNAKN